MSANSTRGERGSLFRSPLFLRYFAGQATSMVGDGTVGVTYAFAALAVTKSGSAMPAVLLGLWGARMVFLGPGGRAAGRRNAAMVMFCADLVRLGAQAFTAICFMIGSPRLWELVLSAVIYGVGNAYFMPASTVIIPMMVPADGIQRANSTISVARNAARLCGPALAAGLYGLDGVQCALWFDVATFFVSVLTLSSVAPEVSSAAAPRSADDTDEGSTQDESRVRLLGAFGVLSAYPVVAWIVAVWCLVQLGVASISVLGPLIAQDELGSIRTWSIIATAMSVGGLLGSAAAGFVRTEQPARLILGSLGLFMPLQLLAMAEPETWTLGIAVACVSAALALCGVLFSGYLQTRIDRRLLARISAAEDGLTSAMIPLGLALCLPLADLLGRRNVLIGLATLIVLVAVTAFTVTRGAPSSPILVAETNAAQVEAQAETA